MSLYFKRNESRTPLLNWNKEIETGGSLEKQYFVSLENKTHNHRRVIRIKYLRKDTPRFKPNHEDVVETQEIVEIKETIMVSV